MTDARVQQLSVEVISGTSTAAVETPAGAAQMTSHKMYVDLDAGWTEVTSDAISDISIQWGIGGSTPNDRLADTGVMTFTLANYDGKYTPGGSGALAGWKTGIHIYLGLTYDGEMFRRFYGTIEEIRLSSNAAGYTTAEVTVVDWMNYAAEHPIVTPTLQTNTRADQALNVLLSEMPVKPKTKLIEEGINTFPSVFDLTRQRSTAYTEFAKLVDSELGYLYLRKDQSNGEQLVFEDAYHRNGLHPISTIPKPSSELDELLQEDGDTILQEDGDTILVSEVEAFTFDNSMLDLGVEHGSNLANRVVVTAYPRKADSAAVVLYQLGRAMQIGNGQTVVFNANYTDPTGGQACGGFDMIDPVATTDYTVNTASDGSGTDLTSSAVVSVVFGANSAAVTIKNTSTSSGYINFFRMRGKGLYTYADVEFSDQDNTSINQYGYFERQFDQPYQDSLTNGANFAKTSLAYDRNPLTVVRAITYCANRSNDLMMAFLSYDIGDLIQITETAMGISSAYFIQNIAARIERGGLVFCTYELVEHWSLLTGTMTGLELTFTDGPTDAINFGYLPQVVQTADRTYCAWIYLSSNNARAVMAAPFADGGGVVIYYSGVTDKSMVLYSNLFDSAPGAWETPHDSFATGQWYHLAISYDTQDTSANPVMYLNGSSVAVTEFLTPSGSLNSEFGAEFIIGNWHSDTQNYTYPWRGKLKDVRIYNRILTADEVTAIYNGGTPSLTAGTTSGLVFHGPVVRKADQTLYDGVTLTEDLKVLDDIYGAAGTPIDSPAAALI